MCRKWLNLKWGWWPVMEMSSCPIPPPQLIIVHCTEIHSKMFLWIYFLNGSICKTCKAPLMFWHIININCVRTGTKKTVVSYKLLFCSMLEVVAAVSGCIFKTRKGSVTWDDKPWRCLNVPIAWYWIPASSSDAVLQLTLNITVVQNRQKKSFPHQHNIKSNAQWLCYSSLKSEN